MITHQHKLNSSRKCAYELVRILGDGSYGIIYETRGPNGTLLAVKVAPEEYINKEVAILRSLEGTNLNYVCKLIDYGTIMSDQYSSKKAFYVMDRLDCTLARLHSNALAVRKKKGKIIASPDIFRLSIQMIKALKELHIRGILHRDVTPSNIMWSCERQQFYLIDFNLSAFCLDACGQPVPKGYESCKGTSIFCSLASHRNEVQCFRDDLESLFYVIVFLFKNELPWSYCDRDDMGEIMQEKLLARKDKQFYKGMPKFMRKWLAQIDALDYGELPDYDEMIYLFLKQFEQKPILYYQQSCWVL